MLTPPPDASTLLINTLATVADVDTDPADGPAWDQASWRDSDDRCGTAMCFAGWATHLAGGRWLWNDDEISYGRHGNLLLATQEEIDEGSTMLVRDRTGERVHTVWVESRARRLLDLTGTQCDRLFDSDNTLGDLTRIVGQILLARTAGDAA